MRLPRTSSRLPSLGLRLPVFLALLGASGCVSGELAVVGSLEELPARDGSSVPTWRVRSADAAGRPVRALLVYVPGSEARPVTGAMEALAGFTLFGAELVLIERRGVGPGGEVDATAFSRASTRPARVADVLDVLAGVARTLPPSTPVVLLGASEGGDVAAAAAAKSSRVTHLMLLGCGGGWTQADELRLLVRDGRNSFGLRDVAELESAFARIRETPDSDEPWLGHPHRRWSTFLWSRPADDLRDVHVPIWLAHGGRDASVPVESARALRDELAPAGNLAYCELPNADHRFLDPSTGTSLLPLLEIEALAWLESQGLVTPAESRAFSSRTRRAHPSLFP